MPEYKFWYLRKVNADNVKQAIRKEKKHKLSFHSVVEVEEEKEVTERASAIGFQYYPEYDDD